MVSAEEEESEEFLGNTPKVSTKSLYVSMSYFRLINP